MDGTMYSCRYHKGREGLPCELANVWDCNVIFSVCLRVIVPCKICHCNM